ncbi:MAG TPA: GNAT family N-acetyltransferase [Candidatus Binatia bacterium]|nr:GNAT family N-acetyltransferase [Candidatus Binatia bacterium]
MQALEIRPAADADREAVLLLLLAQFDEHAIATPPDALRAGIDYILARPDAGRILVAARAGVVVGVAAVTFTRGLEHGGRSAWLEELFVEPSARNAGIGTALLRAACDVALATGAVAIDLEVDAAHGRAAHLYARAGFRTLPRTRWVRRLTTP